MTDQSVSACDAVFAAPALGTAMGSWQIKTGSVFGLEIAQHRLDKVKRSVCEVGRACHGIRSGRVGPRVTGAEIAVDGGQTMKND